ncbi:MAG TPA: integration host factor, actinobacterial type [Candidatus Dormibacteraeota bacterium]|nr:integration host factor, actinobacterial type [Candidatus Dormibacteraeota bacterium]
MSGIGAKTSGDRPPARSLDQRMSALEKANEIRIRRAEFKRQLSACEADLRETLLDVPAWLATMKVVDAVRAVPKIGRVKTRQILLQKKISPSKTLGGLSARQRQAIIAELPDPAKVLASKSQRQARHHPQSQHMEALERANSIRISQAVCKQAIARGELSVREVLTNLPPEMGSMTIMELLRAQNRWGQTRARRLLFGVGISEHKSVGSLTERQRSILCMALDAKQPQISLLSAQTPEFALT